MSLTKTVIPHILHSMSHAPSLLFPSQLSIASLGTRFPIRPSSRPSTKPSLMPSSHGDYILAPIHRILSFGLLAETTSLEEEGRRVSRPLCQHLYWLGRQTVQKFNLWLSPGQYSVREQRKCTCSDPFLKEFKNQDSYRQSQMAIGWTKEKCRYLDQLALEDKSFSATRRERQIFEKNRKLTINLTFGQE